jgi:hypothetical protein
MAAQILHAWYSRSPRLLYLIKKEASARAQHEQEPRVGGLGEIDFDLYRLISIEPPLALNYVSRISKYVHEMIILFEGKRRSFCRHFSDGPPLTMLLYHQRWDSV